MQFSPRKRFIADSQGRVKLRWERFAYLPRDLWKMYETTEPVEFFLDECGIVGHDGLLWLLSIARWRSLHRLGPFVVRLPRDPVTLAFMKDLRFFEHFERVGGELANEVVLWNPKVDSEVKRREKRDEEFSKHPSSPRYIQWIDQNSWNDVAYFTEQFVKSDVLALLGERAQSDVGIQSSNFQKAIRELISNVADHGDSGEDLRGGYACYRPWSRDYPMVRFCCNDVGSGFKKSLERKKEPAPEGEGKAIIRCLLYRFFRPDDAVVGLYPALEFVRKFEGRLQFRSGDAIVVIDLRRREAQEIFDAGYESPSERWLSGLARTRRQDDTRGSHIVLDLRIPGSARSGDRR